MEVFSGSKQTPLQILELLTSQLLIYRESEYAAWTLVNGYSLNHVTISTHRLKSHLRNIKSLNQFIEENGFKLNSEGGVLKGQSELAITLSVMYRTFFHVTVIRA